MAALSPSRRNLTDEQLRTVAARDGIVGISTQRQSLGGNHLATVADHILHAVHVIGAERRALGNSQSLLVGEASCVDRLPFGALQDDLTEPDAGPDR
jgi:hypothetical protein